MRDQKTHIYGKNSPQMWDTALLDVEDYRNHVNWPCPCSAANTLGSRNIYKGRFHLRTALVQDTGYMAERTF